MNSFKNFSRAFAVIVLIFGAFFFNAHSALAVTQIYYSVGQNISNHCGPSGNGTSCGTVTITGGNAVFSAAQNATNLGVGDRLTAGGKIYYLALKQNADNKHWKVVTVLGAVPTDLGSTAVASIRHEFLFLKSAVDSNSGKQITDANHLNTAGNLVPNYSVNVPCYYDSGPEPITSSMILLDGYTTGQNNNIRIYTPTNTSTEVNQSQRHNGKWSSTKYSISFSPTAANQAAIAIYRPYIKIDGLQINIISGYDSSRGIITSYLTTGWVEMSNNIIKGTLSGGYALGLGGGWESSGETLKIYNNLIYDLRGSKSSQAIGEASCYYGSCGTSYIYNNTIINVQDGVSNAWGTSANLVSKNNIVQDADNCFGGTVSGQSDYNICNNVKPVGLNSKKATVTFANKAGKDFHLSASDSTAKDAGVSLSVDAGIPFSVDIDGESRPQGLTSAWDIGADELFVSLPDLTAGVASANATPIVVGAPLTFTANVSNIGTASTPYDFNSFFQVASGAAGGGTVTDLSAVSTPTLTAGSNENITSPSYTFSTAGTHSVRVCADKSWSGDGGTVPEPNEGNNCSGAWTEVTVVPYADVSISADPLSIPRNSPTTLTWSYSHASYCTIDAPGFIGGYPIGSGTAQTPNLLVSTRYTITCDPGGVTSHADVLVEIQPEPFSLNLVKSGQGTVTSTSNSIDPSQIEFNCGAGCLYQTVIYPSGTTVTLTAVPNTSRVFTGWSGACSGKSTCSFLITSPNDTVYANFALYPNFGEF